VSRYALAQDLQCLIRIDKLAFRDTTT